ncbi:HotDog domain-containing protein [Spinellus fusiger]|nr:HotDog domain-containing protein [Spinellus fusiger]
MPVEGFSVDISKAVGHVFPIEKVTCNRRDFLLYALSVGVKEDELRYLFEDDRNFGPLPTYPLVLSLKGNSSDITVFTERIVSGGQIPGMPAYDFNKIVHGEQSLEVINVWPVEGGDFNIKQTCTGVYDKGSGMVIETTYDIYGEKNNLHYARLVSKSFVRGYGGWNGPKGPKAMTYNPPKRVPDAIETFSTAPNQALLYRLSGDYNFLHADVELAPKVGFPKPILHGLCSYGACGHAVIKHFTKNDRSLFKYIEGRFASPVFPGETVEIYMWKVEGPDNKTDAIIFAAKVKERDVLVINNGYALLHKSISDSKL